MKSTYYTNLKHRENQNLLLKMKTPIVLAKNRSIYRHKKSLEDETGPRVETQRVAPLHYRENAAIAAFLRQYQGLRSLVFVRNFHWLRE